MVRKEIALEGAHWRSRADFYDALAASVCGGPILLELRAKA
jgi:hypothetical protein